MKIKNTHVQMYTALKERYKRLYIIQNKVIAYRQGRGGWEWGMELKGNK